jgi:hypothetical protein
MQPTVHRRLCRRGQTRLASGYGVTRGSVGVALTLHPNFIVHAQRATTENGTVDDDE